ncbi:hypothetical protein HDU96_007690 [Phlyctochytrium bullatum]|nr:hypothetical protein HDU96_007690 [Phlyctochytrium bullatum]
MVFIAFGVLAFFIARRRQKQKRERLSAAMSSVDRGMRRTGSKRSEGRVSVARISTNMSQTMSQSNRHSAGSSANGKSSGVTAPQNWMFPSSTQTTYAPVTAGAKQLPIVPQIDLMDETEIRRYAGSPSGQSVPGGYSPHPASLFSPATIDDFTPLAVHRDSVMGHVVRTPIGGDDDEDDAEEANLLAASRRGSALTDAEASSILQSYRKAYNSVSETNPRETLFSNTGSSRKEEDIAQRNRIHRNHPSIMSEAPSLSTKGGRSTDDSVAGAHQPSLNGQMVDAYFSAARTASPDSAASSDSAKDLATHPAATYYPESLFSSTDRSRDAAHSPSSSLSSLKFAPAEPHLAEPSTLLMALNTDPPVPVAQPPVVVELPAPVPQAVVNGPVKRPWNMVTTAAPAVPSALRHVSLTMDDMSDLESEPGNVQERRMRHMSLDTDNGF